MTLIEIQGHRLQNFGRSPGVAPIYRPHIPGGPFGGGEFGSPVALGPEAHERLGSSDEGVAAGEGFGALDDGDRRARLEAVDVDELPQLHLVAHDEVALVEGEADVDGVGGVGDLDVEPVLGQQILLVEIGGDDVGDLHEGAPVLAGGFHPCVHPVQELQKNPRCQGRHDLIRISCILEKWNESGIGVLFS